MLYHKKPDKIYVYGPIVDFRKQINGLCYIVESEFIDELFRNNWFIFISKDKKKVKLLYWRKTGFALWQFRLDKECFKLGSLRALEKTTLTRKDLSRFLNGYNVFEEKPHNEISVKRFS